MRIAGHGLRSHGVCDGDLLVIDRSILPAHGQLVVAEHRGEFLLRPLGWEDGQWLLEPITPVTDTANRLTWPLGFGPG